MTKIHADEGPLSPAERRMLVILPMIGLAAAYALAHWIGGPSRAREIAAAAFANVAGLGTTVILGGAVVGDKGFSHLSPWDLAFVVMVLDAMLTVVYLGVADLVERIAWIGAKVAGARRTARARAREFPWFRHWSGLGVMLFIISPLPGSGVIGGCIFSHILGLSRWRTFLTVTSANIVICVLYAWGADALGSWMTRNDWSIGHRLALLAGGLLLFMSVLKFATGGFRREKSA